MVTLQRAALIAGLVVFLIYGIAATVTGAANLGRAWLTAAALGAVCYGVAAFLIGVVQGATEARRDLRGQSTGGGGDPHDPGRTPPPQP